MKKKNLFFLLCMFPLALLGQQNWTLKQCIAYGLENHGNKAIYYNEKLIADAKAKEALADYLPKISVNGSFDNNLQVQQSVIPAGAFGPEPRKIAFTQKFNTNLTAQLDQTIYDQSLLTGLKANKLYSQQSQLNVALSDQDIIYKVGNAFHQISVYREQVELLKKNTESYRRQMDVFKAQVEKGVALQKDHDKVKVDYNIVMSQVFIAESNVKLAENQLKFEMGFPVDSTLVTEKASTDELEKILSVGIGEEPAISKRIDYRLAALDVSLLEIDEKRIRNQALPKLTAYAKYGAVGFGSTFSPAFSDLNPFSAIGLKLNISVFDFFRQSAQNKQAKYKLINARETLKLNDGKFKMEYENAKTEFLKATTNLSNDRQNIELAEKVFTVTDHQYKKGVTDLTEWLNTRNSIKDAQNNYLNSLYTFYTSKLELEKSKGSLQDFYNKL
ncbi:MAG: TolC family protein [Chitinophagaceae bacterium]|nr:MAG: TolC family protein [Chitinophagaceae bacterium]